MLSGANVVLVVLTRYPEQRESIGDLRISNCIVPEVAVDSRALMYEADLMIGAGGTMTREAALLGVPTYGVYAGRSPAVDRYLERRGLLMRMAVPEDLLPVRQKERRSVDLAKLRESGTRLVEVFVDALSDAGSRTRRWRSTA